MEPRSSVININYLFGCIIYFQSECHFRWGMVLGVILESSSLDYENMHVHHVIML